MSSIDNRVVQMEFDNASFEKGVSQTLNSLKSLNSAIDETTASKGVSSIFENSKFSAVLSSLDEASGKITPVVSKIASGFGTVAKVAGVAFGAINAGITGMALHGGMNRALNIEQAKFQLEGLHIAWDKVSTSINDAVNGTRFGLDSAAKAASQLAASNVELGDNMTHALRAISGVASMTNSEYDDIARTFTRVAGNGRVMAVDLNSIASRGLNAAAAIAKYLKEVEHVGDATEATVREMVSKGKIDFQTFAEAMNWAFGDQAMKANDTFTGAMANTKAALSRIGAQFFVTDDNDEFRGGLEYMRQVFVALIPLINTVGELMKPVSSAFLDFGEVLKNNVVSSLEKVMFLFAEFTNNDKVKGGMWVLAEDENGKKLTQLSLNLIQVFKNLLAAVGSYVEPISIAFQKVFGGESNIAELLTKFSERLVYVSQHLKLTAGAVELFSKPFEVMFNLLKMVSGLFGSAFQAGLSAVLLFADAVRYAAPVLNDLVNGSLKVFGEVMRGVTKTVEIFMSRFNELTSIGSVFSTVIDTISAIADHGLGSSLARVAGLFHTLTNALNDMIDKEFGKNGITPVYAVLRKLRDIVDAVGTAIHKADIAITEFLWNRPLVDFFNDVAQAVKEFFGNALGINGILRQLASNFAELINEGLVQGFRWIVYTVTTLIVDLFRLQRALLDLPGAVYELVTAFFHTNEKAADFLAKLKEIQTMVRNLVLGIGVLAESFGRIVGFAFGIFDPRNWGSGLELKAAREMAAVVNNIRAAFESLRDAIPNTIHLRISQITEQISGLVETIKRVGPWFLKGFADGFEHAMSPFKNGVIKGIQEGVNAKMKILKKDQQDTSKVFKQIVFAAEHPIFQTFLVMIDRIKQAFAEFGDVLKKGVPQLHDWYKLADDVKAAISDFSKVPAAFIADRFGMIGDSMKELIRTVTGGWTEETGQAIKKTFEAIHEAGGPLVDTIDKIKEKLGLNGSARTNAFTPLVNMLGDLRQKVKAYGIGYALGEAIGNPVSALVSIFEKLQGIDFVGPFQKLLSILGELATNAIVKGIMLAANGLNWLIIALTDFIKTIQQVFDWEGFKVMLSSIGDTLKNMISSIGTEGFFSGPFVEGMRAISAAIGEWAGGVIPNAIEKIKEFIGVIKDLGSQALGPIKAFLDGFSENSNQTGGLFGKSETYASGIQTIAEALGIVDKNVSDGGKNIHGALTNSATGLERLAQALGKYFPIIASCAGGIILLIQAIRTGGAIRGATKAVEAVGIGITNTINMVNGWFGGQQVVVKQPGQIGKKIDQIKGLIEAIAKLAGAVVILGSMKFENLMQGALTVTALGLVMVGLATALTKLNKLPEGVTATQIQMMAFNLIIIASAISLLSLAVLVLGRMKPENLIKGIGSVIVMLAVLAASAKILTKIEGDIANLSKSLFLLSSSLVVLAIACIMWSKMKPEQLLAVIPPLILLGVAAKAFQAAKIDKGFVDVAASLLVLSFALIALFGAVMLYGMMPFDMWFRGLGVVAIALGVFVGVARLMQSNTKGFASVAGSLFIMAGALVVFGAAMMIIGSMSLGSWAKGLIGVVVGIAAMTFSLMLLSEAFKEMSTLNILAIAGTFVILSVGILMMAGAVAVLGNMGLGDLVQGILAIVVVLGILLGVAALVGHFPILAAGLEALAAATLAFGIAARNAGAGALMLVVAMGIFAAVAPAAALALVSALGIIIDALPGLILGLLQAIVDIVTGLIAYLPDIIWTALGAVGSGIVSAGRFVVGLFTGGMQEEQPKLEQSARQTVQRTSDTMVEEVDKGNDKIENKLTETTDLFGAAGDGMYESLESSDFNNIDILGDEKMRSLYESISDGNVDIESLLSGSGGDWSAALTENFDISSLGSDQIYDLASNTQMAVDEVEPQLQESGDRVEAALDISEGTSGLDTAAETVDSDLKNLNESIAENIPPIEESTAQLGSALETGTDKIGEQYDKLPDIVVPPVEESMEATNESIKQHIPDLETTSNEAVQSLGEQFDKLPAIVEPKVDSATSGISESIRRNIPPIENAMGTAAQSGVNKFGEQFNQLPKITESTTASARDGIVKNLSTIGTNMRSYGASVTGNYASGMSDNLYKISSAASSAASKAKINVPSQYKTGSDVVAGLSNGMESGIPRLSGIATRIGDLVDKIIRKRNEVKSPSRRLRRTGNYIVDGYILGVRDKMKALEIESETMAETPAKYLARVGDMLNDYLGSDEFNAQPVIKPVFDGSNISAGMDSLFGSPSMMSVAGLTSGAVANARAFQFGPSTNAQNGDKIYNINLAYDASADATEIVYGIANAIRQTDLSGGF